MNVMDIVRFVKSRPYVGLLEMQDNLIDNVMLCTKAG